MFYHIIMANCKSAAACGHNLVAVKRECAVMADCTQMLALVPALGYKCAYTFGGVLNNCQVVFCCVHKAFHIRHVAEYMNRYHSFNMSTCGFVYKFVTLHFAVVVNKILYAVRVHAKMFVTVNKHRFRTAKTNGVYSGDKC